MPPAETIPAPPVTISPPPPIPSTLRGWGRAQPAAVRLVSPDSVTALQAALALSSSAGAIPRGMGRSYGDAAQLSGGIVIDTTRMKGFELDPEQGTVTAQAGVTLGELLHALVSEGWVVPVLPGTQHVTVGGAIASDIHGKNHGTDGTFGTYVRALGLMTAAGEVVEREPDSDDGLLAATIGGMGLTGVILWARIALRPVTSSLVSVDTDRARDLEHALELLSAPGGPHRVAWLDLMGSPAGRGVVTRAEHVDGRAIRGEDAAEGATVTARATVPSWWPGGLLRPSTVRAHNELRYRLSPQRRRGKLEPLGAHMFPLDVLDAWPRLYGRHGFLQYQLVVPANRADVLATSIERLRATRVPCYLAVLKDFGPANQMPLSFPIEGWTLTLDVPRAAPGLERVLAGFDELVAEAGGRVYLSKDARMRPEALKAMYPRLSEWRAIRERFDPERVWRSDLAIRTGLIGR
jgi:decaprenylphospho-beta-D-ribofuranose 2-oxidase